MIKAIVFALALIALPRMSGDDQVVKAMKDELGRSTSRLRLDSMAAPYFVAYRVRDVTEAEASATLGSLIASDERRNRQLSAEVRVGDYRLDNTNFVGTPTGMIQVMIGREGGMPLPLEDDYQEIR